MKKTVWIVEMKQHYEYLHKDDYKHSSVQEETFDTEEEALETYQMWKNEARWMSSRNVRYFVTYPKKKEIDCKFDPQWVETPNVEAQEV